MFELPKRKILVHKPVELRNLSATVADSLDITSEGWYWQLKYDGCHGIMVVDGDEARLYSREGNECCSMVHLNDIMRRFPDGVYFGEVWSEMRTFPEISGAFRRQKWQPDHEDFEFRVFDYVTLDEFQTGRSDTPYVNRCNKYTDACLYAYREGYNEDMRVWRAQSFRGNSPSAKFMLDQSVQALKNSGYVWGNDGYIAKRLDAPWIAGGGLGGEQIKVKDHISVDLKCVGLTEGKGKFKGMVGNLLVEWHGKVVPVSGGKLTNEWRQNYWAVYERWTRDGNRPHPHLLLGKIVEVHALGLTPDGQLREPRFQRIRHDKTEPSV